MALSADAKPTGAHIPHAAEPDRPPGFVVLYEGFGTTARTVTVRLFLFQLLRSSRPAIAAHRDLPPRVVFPKPKICQLPERVPLPALIPIRWTHSPLPA